MSRASALRDSASWATLRKARRGACPPAPGDACSPLLPAFLRNSHPEELLLRQRMLFMRQLAI
eukprot:8548199-Pyramimonas_sp.AAC.1